MLIRALQNLLKILVFALLFALEVSIAVPVVSMMVLLVLASKSDWYSQVFLLLVGSLIVSSFLGIPWSLVALLFGMVWMAIVVTTTTWMHQQTACVVGSLVLAVILGTLAEVSFNYKTAIYTVLLIVAAIAMAKVFVPRRLRHTVIDWMLPTKR